MNTAPLEDYKINVKIKLAALWTAAMFLYIYGDYFALYIPGQATKLVSGNTLLNSPVEIFAASVLMSLPPMVIIATVLASAKLARVLNLIFGSLFTAIMLLIAITAIPITPEVSAYVFYAMLESVITSIIIWQAWTWPKQKG